MSSPYNAQGIGVRRNLGSTRRCIKACLSYESRWGHKRPSHNSDWNMQKFRFIVYTLIHGLTVRHTPDLITATSTPPPPPPPPPPYSYPRKNHSAVSGLGWTLNCKAKTFARFHADLEKEVCTDLCVLLLVVNNTTASRERDWTMESWYIYSKLFGCSYSSSSHSTSCSTVATFSYVYSIHIKSNHQIKPGFPFIRQQYVIAIWG